MPFVLIVLNIVFILLLLPWLSVAFWFGNFLNDAITSQPFHQLFTLRNAGLVVALLYPALVVYGAVSSWYLLKKGKGKSRIILNALSPLLSLALVIPLLTFPGGYSASTPVDDSRIQALLEAAQSFDREKHGFTPIQQSADFRLQMYGDNNYDVMLHVNDRFSDAMLLEKGITSRTVAFKETADGYRWVFEQEIFVGPDQYENFDRMKYENITLTYQIEKVSSYALNQLKTSYAGRDSRLLSRPDLNAIKPVLKEWGYYR